MKTILFPELVGEMAKRGETQKDLGKIIGVSYGSVCRRFQGNTRWTKDEIDKICEHYQKTYEELFKKEGK